MRTLLGLLLVLPLVGRAASLTIEDQTFAVPTGTEVLIPILASIPVTDAALALELELALPGNWTALGVDPVSGMLNQQGADLSVSTNGNLLQLAASSSNVLSGTGVLVEVRALISGTGWSSMSNVIINEGGPSVGLDQGYLTHSPPPVLTLQPNVVQNLLIGDTVPYTCVAAVPPLVWSSLNPGVGSVDAGGMFTAGGQGQTRVLLDDGAGSHGQSQLITVYSHGISVVDLTGTAGSDLELQLMLDNPDSRGFNSLQCTVNLGSNRLSLLGVETAGTLCENWAGLQAVQNGNLVTVVGADASVLNGEGTLLILRLHSTPGSSLFNAVTLDQASLDENNSVLRSNGTVNLAATGTYTLGPLSPTLKRGESQTVSVTGTPNGAISWSSSDPLVGIVDAGGVFHALSGGQTRISGIDELGQTAETGFWQVVDLDLRLGTSVEVAQGGSALVPLHCDSLVGLSVQSFECALSWTAGVLNITGVVTENSLCENLGDTAFFGDSLSAAFSVSGQIPDTAGLPLIWFVCELDPEAIPGQTLSLQLSEALFDEGYPVVRRSNGSVLVMAGTGVEEPPVTTPGGLELLPNWPNPFNPETRIAFRTAAAGHVSLAVYDLQGRRTVQLLDSTQPAGMHSLIWNGRTAGGAPAASGSYLLLLEHEGRSLSRRITLLR